MSIQKLTELHDRVSVEIFGGRSYTTKPVRWTINLQYNWDGVIARVSESAPEFEDALFMAWNKLERLITVGLGSAAMRPALEAPKTETVADDIPF